MQTGDEEADAQGGGGPGTQADCLPPGLHVSHVLLVCQLSLSLFSLPLCGSSCSESKTLYF